MLRVTPIRFTDDSAGWARLLSALGMNAVVEDEGWSEFDSHSGGVRLHAAEDAHPSGSTLLAFEVGDLDEFARRTRLDGVTVEITDEAHGRTAHIPGPDGITLQATVARRDAAPGDADPLLHVLSLWNSPDVDGAAKALLAIGARPEVSSESGGWHQFRAKNGGLVAVHAGTTASEVLSFQYDGELEALRNRLVAAGLEAALIDESYGRTLRIPDPDGGEDIWVNEVQTDLHGYHRA